MIRTLRRRFVVITMTIVTVMLVVIFGLVLVLTHQRIVEDNLHMMQNVATAPIGANFRFQPGRPEGRNIKLPFFRVVVDPDGTILDTDGNVFDVTDTADVSRIVEKALQQNGRSGELMEYNLRFLKARANERMVPATRSELVTTDAGSATRETGANRVIVFADISSEMSTMHNLIRNCIFIGIFSFLVFWGIAFYFARWAVKPVEDAWNQQRQFVSDASHELKTPLTVILTNAELLKNSVPGEARRTQFVENILVMSNQMRGLVDSLLQLARVDHDVMRKIIMEQVSFSQVCEEAMLRFEVLFFEKGLELRSEIMPEIYVKGSAQHLRQVVEILLDNAQKYADAKGKVTMKLKKTKTHAVLSIADPGEAMSEEELKNIFKRFYRVDEARAMNHSYGLGLAIAEGIVHHHHGRIFAASRDGYNIFTVELPLMS